MDLRVASMNPSLATGMTTAPSLSTALHNLTCFLAKALSCVNSLARPGSLLGTSPTSVTWEVQIRKHWDHFKSSEGANRWCGLDPDGLIPASSADNKSDFLQGPQAIPRAQSSIAGVSHGQLWTTQESRPDLLPLSSLSSSLL